MTQAFRARIGIARGCRRALAAGLVMTTIAGASASAWATSSAADAALQFDPDPYTSITVSIDGVPTPVRWYKNLCYVSKPVAMAALQGSFGGPPTTPIADTRCGYQSMNVFVPESSANNQRTALYLAVNNGGWFASYLKASLSDGASLSSSTSNVGAAIKAGYVYIDLATRGRNVYGADGNYPGKAPAVVVDAKAAVRYLRLNDARMPGSAERIVVNGTSGGGGLSAILGASGNSTDYLPYLAEIGAAGLDSRGHSRLRDDVLAINAYCPITDLGHADIAYEWLFTTLGTRSTVGNQPDPAGSAELAARFPAYQQRLQLRDSDGQRLSSDRMLAAIEREVRRSAERAMADGQVLPNLGEDMPYTAGGFGGPPVLRHYVNDWLAVDNANRQVISIDMTRYLAFVATQAALKTTPAFDSLGIAAIAAAGSRGESSLFGTAAQPYANFTEFSWTHNDTANDGTGQDDTQLTWAEFNRQSPLVRAQTRMIDPMRYIGRGHDTAPYWYIRHGTRDRDTAFTVSINLSRALAADPRVRDLNYLLAWNQPHAGNYDVPEAMQWIAKVLKQAERSGPRH